MFYTMYLFSHYHLPSTPKNVLNVIIVLIKTQQNYVNYLRCAIIVHIHIFIYLLKIIVN